MMPLPCLIGRLFTTLTNLQDDEPSNEDCGIGEDRGQRGERRLRRWSGRGRGFWWKGPEADLDCRGVSINPGKVRNVDLDVNRPQGREFKCLVRGGGKGGK